MEIARLLRDAWNSSDVEKQFYLIDVTAGNATSIQTIPGIGVTKNEIFEGITIYDLQELAEYNLVSVEENNVGRGIKWKITLKSDLKSFDSTDQSIQPFSTPTKALPEIFISYKSEDSNFRNDLTEVLRRAYNHVWSDDRLQAGDKWWNTILENINQADIFIYLLSEASAKSLYCRAELAEAIRLNKYIIPLKIQEATLIPNYIADWQVKDVSQGIKDPESLITIFSALIRKQPVTTVKPVWENAVYANTDNSITVKVKVNAKKDPSVSEDELNTGILMLEGDHVTIHTSGSITYNKNGTSSEPDGNEKNSRTYKVNGEEGKVGELIGWNGRGNYQNGNAYSIVSIRPSSRVGKENEGFLYLAVNDARGEYDDNEGFYDVTITVKRD